MIAVALSAFGFLRGNWTWAIPTIALAAVSVWGGIQRYNYVSCKAAWAQEIVDAYAAREKYKAEDAKATAELTEKFNAEKAELLGRSRAREDQIRVAPNSCPGGSEPFNALFDRLRRQQEDRASKAGPAGGTNRPK